VNTCAASPADPSEHSPSLDGKESLEGVLAEIAPFIRSEGERRFPSDSFTA
jgi:hypothetical protein